MFTCYCWYGNEFEFNPFLFFIKNNDQNMKKYDFLIEILKKEQKYFFIIRN